MSNYGGCEFPVRCDKNDDGEASHHLSFKIRGQLQITEKQSRRD